MSNPDALIVAAYLLGQTDERKWREQETIKLA
jgi:hypothetical protein